MKATKIEAPSAPPAPPATQNLTVEDDLVDADWNTLTVSHAETPEQQLIFKYARLMGRYRDEIARIKTSMEAMLAEAESKCRSLEWKLSLQVSTVVKKMLEGGRHKHVKTPYGRLGYRHTAAGLTVTDESVIPDSLKELVPSREKIAQYIVETGDVIPGVLYKPAGEKFYVQ